MLLKKGSRGTAVQTMQKLLKLLGYSINPDGVFGAMTEQVVRLFQESTSLVVDGIVGNNTYNKLIALTKFVTQDYRETATWISPRDLKIGMVNQTGSTLSGKFKNFTNGTYFWDDKGTNKAIGWMYGEGKVIQSNNITMPRGTFLVLKSGEVICRRMTNAELLEYKNRGDIWFCIQGFEAADAKNMKAVEGWNILEVGRKCIRPVLGYNPSTKMVLVAMFNGDYADAGAVLKKYNCVGIGLDGGGSSNMFIDGKAIYKTSRVLNNIIYW